MIFLTLSDNAYNIPDALIWLNYITDGTTTETKSGEVLAFNDFLGTPTGTPGECVTLNENGWTKRQCTQMGNVAPVCSTPLRTGDTLSYYYILNNKLLLNLIE